MAEPGRVTMTEEQYREAHRDGFEDGREYQKLEDKAELDALRQKYDGLRAMFVVALVGTGRERDSAEQVVTEVEERLAALAEQEAE